MITGPRTACEKVLTVLVADSVSMRSKAVCFAAFDEAAFLPSDDWLAEKDVDLLRALSPSMLQFQGTAQTMFASSPGKPGSLFHKLATGKQSADTLRVSGPTWLFSPTITEADCRREAGDDVELFEREFAARRWGASGEAFMSSTAVWRCLGSRHAGGRGPQPGGHYVLALDIGQLTDASAICVCSSFERDIGPTTAPVKHVRVEHSEAIAASKTSPIPIEALAARVRDLSRHWNNAPIVFDGFCAPTVKRDLLKLGLREFDDPSGERVPKRGTFSQRPMHAPAQTSRWRGLRSLVDGGRLHMRPDDEPIARQLVELKATMLSGGALRVDGKRDDLADVLNLAAEIALKMPPTGGPDGAVEQVIDGVAWKPDEGGLSVRSRWVRKHANGAEESCEPPLWSPTFPQYREEMREAGIATPNTLRWDEQEKERAERAFEVPIIHD